FHVDILAGLARPDGHEGVPVVRRGNGDCINRLVLEQLANVNKRLRLRLACADPSEPFGQDAFVHVTKGRNLPIGEARKPVQVVLAATMQAADGHSDPVVGTEYSFRLGKECHTLKCSQSCRGSNTLPQEISTLNVRLLASHRLLLLSIL